MMDTLLATTGLIRAYAMEELMVMVRLRPYICYGAYGYDGVLFEIPMIYYK